MLVCGSGYSAGVAALRFCSCACALSAVFSTDVCGCGRVECTGRLHAEFRNAVQQLGNFSRFLRAYAGQGGAAGRHEMGLYLCARMGTSSTSGEQQQVLQQNAGPCRSFLSGFKFCMAMRTARSGTWQQGSRCGPLRWFVCGLLLLQTEATTERVFFASDCLQLAAFVCCCRK